MLTLFDADKPVFGKNVWSLDIDFYAEKSTARRIR